MTDKLNNTNDELKTTATSVDEALEQMGREEGHAAAWGGGGLLTILVIVVLLILIF